MLMMTARRDFSMEKVLCDGYNEDDDDGDDNNEEDVLMKAMRMQFRILKLKKNK